jgi:hypothetical protein
VDRHRHHVVDADLPVVLVEERRAPEGAVRLQIVDAPGLRRGVAPVVEHERMDVEIVIENLDLAPRDRARLVADHRTVPGVEIAGGEGSEVAADQVREALHAAAREVLGAGAVRADRLQRVERGAQFTAGQLHVAPPRWWTRDRTAPLTYQLVGYLSTSR